MKSVLATYLIVVIAAISFMFACPSCKLFDRGLDPDVVTEKAEEFLPTAANVCLRLKAYAPDDASVQTACDRVLALLENPEQEIRVAELEDLLWLVPLHNDFVLGDPDTSDSYAVTADALKYALETYLGRPHDVEGQ